MGMTAESTKIPMAVTMKETLKPAWFSPVATAAQKIAKPITIQSENFFRVDGGAFGSAVSMR